MKEKLPMVSIIVPVYQVSDYIERCIMSIMSQTYEGEMECIIVNDATQDDSIEKCERLIHQYQGHIKFRIVCHKVNRGLSAARNTGTDEALGEYLYYIDSDDDIMPDSIEKLMSFILRNGSIEMVQGNFLNVSDKQEEMGTTVSMYLESNEDIRFQFFRGRNIYVNVWNKLIRRDFVNDNKLYCKEGLINEDVLWAFNLLKYINKAYIYRGVTYNYRIRPGSIITGSKPRENGLSFCVIYEEILHNLTQGNEKVELYRFLYHFIDKYILYRKSTPELSPIYQLYREFARRNGCYYVLFLLSVICPLYKMPFIYPILRKFNQVRVFLSVPEKPRRVF